MHSFQIASLALALTVSRVVAKDITVDVGLNGLTFTPNQVTAEIGDNVIFTMHPKNHTVTQSTFAKPCELLNNATTGAVGFDTSYVPVAPGSTTLPTYTLQVNTTGPIWVYCAQGNHCASGMVGAINAPATGNTFDKFLATATGGNAAIAGGASASAGGVSSVPAGNGGLLSGGTAAAPSGGVSSPADGTSDARALQFSSALLLLLGTVSLVILA